MAEIGEHSDAPIYTCWDFLGGAGTVGGRVIQGREHGRLAASMVLRILSGERASDIPRVAPVGDLYLFDYNGLKRFHIPEGGLPRGSEILNKPYYFFRINPQIFWIIMVALALLAATLVFLVINISRRRTVEEKIRAQLSFLTLLLDNIPQLVFWKDRDQRYQGANRAFAAFFGLPDPAVVVGKTNPEVLPRWWDHAGMAEEADREVMRSETPRRLMRLEFSRDDGDPAWLELNKVPLRDRKGHVVGTLSTAEDFTDKERLEARLRQSQKMEAVGTLAGGLAHDFNNILTTIINSTEMALLDLEGDSQTAEDLRRVLAASRRGAGIVRQILTFSRPSRENFREADIAGPVMEATGLLAATLPGNIRLETDIQVVTAMCRADPNQIHQVVMNLCANAYQALRRTGGVIRVVLGTVRLSDEEGLPLDLPAGRYLRLCVADDGPGIDPRSSTTSSTLSSPPARTTAAPGSGGPWSRASCATTTAGWPWPRPRARGPRFPSTCPAPGPATRPARSTTRQASRAPNGCSSWRTTPRFWKPCPGCWPSWATGWPPNPARTGPWRFWPGRTGKATGAASTWWSRTSTCPGKPVSTWPGPWPPWPRPCPWWWSRAGFGTCAGPTGPERAGDPAQTLRRGRPARGHPPALGEGGGESCRNSWS